MEDNKLILSFLKYFQNLSTFNWLSAFLSFSLSLSLSFSFTFPTLALSSSGLNIPGSKPVGPEVPAPMPGNETELSEWNSVLVRFGSDGLESISSSGSGSFSTLISTGVYNNKSN